ncbi:G-protein coupled receptor Mth2-like isoform X1 [Macrosteles quadrilineatus]|uniref:G-protein coupled receptor Mth2-like isoform X1 n=1 Tax=Macrosteles quadrilineatus TaxID=74068 RepID=UPI0023E14F49|nr:G-protein coupled receptor Mth2-like isoform X1 [Macrosteles quadrilineatus]
MDLSPVVVSICLAVLTVSEGKEVCVVPKCCPPNQTILPDGGGCYSSNLTFEPEFWNGTDSLPPASSMEPLNVIVGDPCQYGKFRLEPEEDSNDEFHILCNGSLLVPFQSDQLYGLNHYCLEAFPSPPHPSTGGNGAVTLPLLCFPPPPPPPTVFEKIAMAVYPVGLLISVPFLILTTVIFAGLPELRDTQGKSLACHCGSLTVAFLALAIVKLAGDCLPQKACVTFAFVIQFSFVACFFWLNVLCIDTWWRLTRKPCWSSRQERVRFLWYSLYAWSMPLMFGIVTIVMELTPVVPNAYLKPSFGLQSCWFHSKAAALPYFYAPIGLLLLANIGLFCLSISAVRSAVEQRVEEELGLNAERNPCSYSKASRRVEMFKHCLILFVVMGLNWTLELLSYFIGGPIEVWLVTDTLNTLQGVIIYVVFVVSVPRVKHLASNRLMPACGQTKM